MPVGHEHSGWWFCGVQMAWGLQGFSVTQGLTHLRLSQARDGGQSLSEEHPISRGGSKRKKGVKSQQVQISKMLVLPIKSHRSSPLPEYPGLHVQTMTLHGSSSFTAQFAFLTQGLRWTHGLRHSPEKQACLDGQSPSVTQPGSSMTGSGTGENYIFLTEICVLYIYWTYLECKQFHMDLLYSQGNMCNIPCDFWVSNQHIGHIDRDRHIFHCHIFVLLGSQGLPNTRMVCIDHMDCQCGWACKCKWICGPSHYTKHFDHTVHRGKDPGILYQSKPLSVGIRHLIYIQLWRRTLIKTCSKHRNIEGESYVLCRLWMGPQ